MLGIVSTIDTRGYCSGTRVVCGSMVPIVSKWPTYLRIPSYYYGEMVAMVMTSLNFHTNPYHTKYTFLEIVHLVGISILGSNRKCSPTHPRQDNSVFFFLFSGVLSPPLPFQKWVRARSTDFFTAIVESSLHPSQPWTSRRIRRPFLCLLCPPFSFTPLPEDLMVTFPWGNYWRKARIKPSDGKF